MSPSDPDPDPDFDVADLPALRGPVRAFLGRILRDADAADDATSETLLIVLRKLRAGLVVGRPTSFALGVAWNRAQKRRLPTRDAPAALTTEPADVAPDPTRAAEVREWLLAAMSALTPEQRALLHLRFERDLSYAEIGAILGIGVPLVGWRLHRARKALRDALERSGDGELVPVALALLPLLGDEGAAVGALGTAGTGTVATKAASVGLWTGLAMKKLIGWAAATIAALWLLGIAVLHETPPSSPERAAAGAADGGAAGGADTAPLAEASDRAIVREAFADPAVAAATRPNEAAATPRIFVGLVTDEADRPAAGVEIALLPRPGRPAERVATTDEGGLFRVAAPTDATDEGEWIATAPGYVPAVAGLWTGRETRAADGVHRVDFELALARATGLYGTVRDARTGAPVPGAVVRLAPRFGSVEGLLGDAPTVDADVASRRLPAEPDVAASTDLSGRYALAGAPPRFGARGDAAATALAVAVAPGYAPAALRYAPPDAPGDGARADAELAPEARATGRVVDAAGKPIPRARVRAAFSAVPSPNGGDVACAADPRPGEPLRFQSVVERATTTDDDGRYRFAGLAVPPGETWTLRIFDDRPDRLLHVETPPVTVACPAGAAVEAPDLTLPALPTYAVRVRALDRRGAPIAGAALSFVADPDYEEPLDAPRRTDADGRVELPAPSRWRRPEGRTPASEDGPTRLWLRAAAPGRATRFVPDVVLRRTEALGEETTVVLDEERTAEGVVVDAVGRPVPRAVVEARAEAADSRPGLPTAWYRRFAEARTDAEGRFTLRALPADPLTISARAPTPGERRADVGAMLFSRPVLSAPAGPFAEAIPLLRLTLPTQVAPDGGRLVVVLTEASGAPFSGSASAILVEGGREVRRATARPFGRATFDDVPPGTYDVALAAAGRRPTVVAEVVVRAGERVEVAATLLEGLAVSGVARTADGSPPPPGGRVFATSVDGRFSAHAELDADGRFVLSGLGPGRWVAQAERFAVAEQDGNRFTSPRVPFDVAEGRATELALPMRPARHAKVVARGGAAHGADVGLRVLGLDGAEWLVSTFDGAERRGVAEGGDFTLFGALPPGPCRIEFLRAGAPFSSRLGDCPDDLGIDVR